jgi:hypothetical protein
MPNQTATDWNESEFIALLERERLLCEWLEETRLRIESMVMPIPTVRR